MYPLLILLVFLFSLNSLPAPLPSKTKPTTPILQTLPSFDSCLIRGQPSRNSFSFFNACPERVNINVCTTDITGETKLYQSGRQIPIGGRYTIFTFYEVKPQNVTWSADPILAAIPPPCDIPQKGKKGRR